MDLWRVNLCILHHLHPFVCARGHLKCESVNNTVRNVWMTLANPLSTSSFHTFRKLNVCLWVDNKTYIHFSEFEIIFFAFLVLINFPSTSIYTYTYKKNQFTAATWFRRNEQTTRKRIKQRKCLFLLDKFWFVFICAMCKVVADQHLRDSGEKSK